MAIWLFLKETVLILLVSILTTTFSTDFSKVLTKVKFSPENSPALNKFFEQLLIKQENLKWVDRLSQTYNGIGRYKSGLEMRKKISKRNNLRYRKRRNLRPYYTNYKNQNQNFLNEISHLNLDDYENALTGVLKKDGYKKQKVKQKRHIPGTPLTTHEYKSHAYFNLLDLSITDPNKKRSTYNYHNNKRKEFSKNKSKKQAITTNHTKQFKNCNPKPIVNIKPEELEEMLKVVEPTTKSKNHNLLKNKTLGIMNSKKQELTITKSYDIRQKNAISSQHKLQTTTAPILAIFIKSLPTEKILKKKSITIPISNKALHANSSTNMISKISKIQEHLEKNIFFTNPHIEQQIDASPTNAKIKSINLDNLHIMTDPYIYRLTNTTIANHINLQKREKIVEEDPASVMSPEEIRRAKIEAEKLMDVDKDFNERNEPDFNKEVMKTKNNDYKEIYDYLDLKDKINRKHKNNLIQNKEIILKSEKKHEIKSNDIQQSRFFSRQLLHYDYDDYENKLYSNYDDEEIRLNRYPRDVNQNYRFQNVGDDYFDYQNEEPLERRFYKKRWKKEANSRNNEQVELKNKINKLKNFFGIGHENNYNENVEDDYPVENMLIADNTAKNNQFNDGNILNIYTENPSKNPEDLQNINEPHNSENVNSKNFVGQQNNFDAITLSKNPLATTASQIHILNSIDLNKGSKQNKNSLKINSKLNQNSIHKNLKDSSITKTIFSDDSSSNYGDLKSKPKEKMSNALSSKFDKLFLHDSFTKHNGATTLLSDPLYYSFSYKNNIFDASSSSTSNFLSPIKKVNLKEKRESIVIKNLLKRYKMKQDNEMITRTFTTVKLNDLTTSNADKANVDKFLSLNNKRKLINKYKFHHLPKYHSDLKEMLKSLPSQIPAAQVHVDELKLNAIKKNREKNKNVHTRETKTDVADNTYDLDDEDYIPTDYGYFKNSETMAHDEELEHSDRMVKHTDENFNDSNKYKSHKHQPDIEDEKNDMKVAKNQKYEDNIKYTNNKKAKVNSNDIKKKQDNANVVENTKKINPLQTINKKNYRKMFNENKKTQLVYTKSNNAQKNILRKECKSNSSNKITSTSTKTCSAKQQAATYPSKKSCLTTCQSVFKAKTTCPTKICPAKSDRTTCPTTCKTTTCPTTTCKTTTCPTTTCKTTTCPTTTCSTTTATCYTTTCPTKTTTCKTTTTCKNSTKLFTTCKSSFPTTTTCNTTTKMCPITSTTCKTISSKTKATSCTPKCEHAHSTHKFGTKCTPRGKIYNILDRSKRKTIHNSQYFNNKYHKAKFNANSASRHLIFPKRKYLYNGMSKNKYQEMKHKNLIRRLKKKYLSKLNSFPETKKNNLIRRKKSINFNEDVKHIVEMPIYKIYPKRIRYERYRRRKMKTDDSENEEQRKILETIYRHRILRRRNEPEYVRKSHSYDYIENNANLPSSYNSEIKKNLIRRTRVDNLNNTDLKETTSSDSTDSDALKGKIPAIVVHDLYTDINKCINIKKIIGKALRCPQHDPKNPFPNLKKCEKEKTENSQKELQNIIDDVKNKLNSMLKLKVNNDNCIKIDKDTLLFLKIITANIKNADNFENEESDVPVQNMNLFSENNFNLTSSNGTTFASSTSINEMKSSTCQTDKNATKSAKTSATTTAKATTTKQTVTTKSLIDICKTVIMLPDPCNTKSSTTDPCKVKAKTKSPTTKIMKTKSCTTIAKITQTTNSTTANISNSQTTTTDIKLSCPKIWEKPIKLKIEVFKSNNNKNCSELNKLIQNRKKLRRKIMDFQQLQENKSSLNVHKVKKFNDIQKTVYKLPVTHREVTNLLTMYSRLPQAEKKRNKYIFSYLHTQKLFLERLIHQFTKYNRQHRKIMLPKKLNFQERNHHIVWVPNELSTSENSNYMKLKKRMIGHDRRTHFRSRLKRENYLRENMKAKRKPEATISKLDEWMKVNDEEHKPQFLNFTFLIHT